MPRVLIVTNDFPPRAGGIQSFVHALAVRLPEGSVTVYAPAWAGAAGFDAAQPTWVQGGGVEKWIEEPVNKKRPARSSFVHMRQQVLNRLCCLQSCF